jgi:hypothetical protein
VEQLSALDDKAAAATAPVATTAPAAATASTTAADATAAPDGPARWTAEDLERLSGAELAKVRSDVADPPNPALAVRDGSYDSSCGLLDEMELACCYMQHEGPSDELQLPRFRITARPSTIREPELRQMAVFISRILGAQTPFTILWDLRKLRPPSLSALKYGTDWQSEHAAELETPPTGQVTSIVVLVGSPVTRVCANLCARVCDPPQPLLICTGEAEALEFARRNSGL